MQGLRALAPWHHYLRQVLWVPMLLAAWLTPVQIQRWLARTTARFVYVLAPRLRRQVARNQLRVQSDLDAAQLRRSVLNVYSFYGFYLMDFFALLRRRHRPLFGEHSDPAALTVLQQTGRGIILTTAHIGSWEIAAFSLSLTHRDADVSMVSEKEEIGYLGRLRTSIRKGMKHQEVLLEGRPHSSIGLLATLRGGGLVGLQMDRPGFGSRTEAVPFFDHMLKMPTGIARLARLTDSWILPVFALFNPEGTYDVIIEPPLDSRAMDETEILRALARIMEKHVRRHPEQWLMIKDPWADSREQ